MIGRTVDDFIETILIKKGTLEGQGVLCFSWVAYDKSLYVE